MSFAAIAIGGAVVAGAGTIGGIASRASANKQIREQLKNRPKPQISNLAKTLLNARMPGAAQAERNIYQSGANTMGRTQQAATSAADVMQAAAGIQSQTNNAMAALGLQEAGDYQRRYGNLVNEEQYNQAQRMQDFETVNSAQAAIAQNRAKSWGDVTQFGMGAASAALGGAGTNKTTGASNLIGKGTASAANAGTSAAMPSQNMMYGTGGGITQPPMIGGTTPAYFSNLIGRTPIPQQDATPFDYNNPWFYGGYRTR